MLTFHLGPRVEDLAANQLFGKEREVALAHVARCSLCREALSAARTVREQLLGAPDPTVRVDFTARLMQMSVQIEGTQPAATVPAVQCPNTAESIVSQQYHARFVEDFHYFAPTEAGIAPLVRRRAKAVCVFGIALAVSATVGGVLLAGDVEHSSRVDPPTASVLTPNHVSTVSKH